MSVVKTVVHNPALRTIVRWLLKRSYPRQMVIKYLERQTRRALIEENVDGRPVQVQRDKADLLVALLAALDRGLARGLLSSAILDNIMSIVLDGLVLSDEMLAQKPLSQRPPLFLTISPTQRCNLRCTGCYACSDAARLASLEYDLVVRIIRQKRQLWNSRFSVISGGEPFLWQDGGRDLFSLAAEFADELFMVYTNGTLIDDETARRIAELGNVSPAISVEGFERETDGRRGRGVHARILAAFERLRRHGVPFGISATAASGNWRVVTSPEFADYYFIEHGAAYGWLFQYMPIGRGCTLALQVPPAERIEMWRRMWRLVREKKIFYADFWNSGTTSDGCIAAGRPRGYFYINWHGDVTPCVFVPYACANIRDVYSAGGTLNDMLAMPLFRRIRQFQDESGYDNASGRIRNWLCPCSIRDHYDTFHKIAIETGARPIDEEAACALNDPDYRRGLGDYGRELAALTDDLWQANYICTETSESEVVA